MFPERNETLTEYVDALMAACKPLGRGDLLPHEQIEAILGVRRHEDHWLVCMAKLKRRMLDERGVQLLCEMNEGYRLLTARDQATLYPRLQTRHAHRRLTRALNAVEAIGDRELSPYLRRIRNAQIDGLRHARKEAARLYRQQAAFLNPSKPLPRPAAAT